ncbi:MAG: BamA/TamA family outer membrane protein [candidate division Zixibacteria bacterium]|nr:BamA/TamA family outer membrane protein [candidate division Zixibacteria bacterium]
MFLLSNLANAAGGKNIKPKTLEIVINGDTIIVSVNSKDGDVKTVMLNEWDFPEKKTVKTDSGDSSFQINNELIISNDGIIIDGMKFSQADIDNLIFTNNDRDGLSINLKLPHKKYIYNNKKVIDASRYNAEDRVSFDNLVIDSDEVINGDVVSLTGDVKVYGKVFGDVVSIFGDVVMYEGSFAGGDIEAPFGEIITRSTAIIEGKPIPKIKHRHQTNDADFDLAARYNRVEGLVLLCGINYSDGKGELPDVDINAGYAFALKRWDYKLGLRQEFGNDWAAYFGGNIYRGAATPDEWIFEISENSISSLLFKEDFHDFYYRKGINGYVGQKLAGEAFIQLGYTSQANEVLTKNTNAALFGGNKNFRQNYSTVGDDPSILESINGDLRMIGLTIGWDNRLSESWPTSGQYAEVKWESAGDGIIADLGGDHSYDIVKAALYSSLKLTSKQHFGFWARGGYSDQQLPLNQWFFLGGVGSLRGYDYKEFAGNRYILANLDYYFDFSDDFTASLFADVGKVGFGEQEYNDSKCKTDIGIGLIVNEVLRIDIAQRFDETSKGPVVMGRLDLHF